jgi:hypothetical protein
MPPYNESPPIITWMKNSSNGHLYTVQVKCHGGVGVRNMMVPLGDCGAIVSSRIKNSSTVILALATGADASLIVDCCRTITSELGSVISCHRIFTDQEYEATFCVTSKEKTFSPFILGVATGIVAHMASNWAFGTTTFEWVLVVLMLVAYALTR